MLPLRDTGVGFEYVTQGTVGLLSLHPERDEGAPGTVRHTTGNHQWGRDRGRDCGDQANRSQPMTVTIYFPTQWTIQQKFEWFLNHFNVMQTLPQAGRLRRVFTSRAVYIDDI